ncbi:MAG: YraN family protein [Gemmatales bacterium]|nr:YraN family protein [Gemmatales bacterium]MDW8388150.1 YraN family protein [Gemmatales bacterium]
MPDPSPRLPWWRRWFGLRSEQWAAEFLVRQGHRILDRNWRCPLGEIDLVTQDGPCIVFVEVRSTDEGNMARPAYSVDESKQARLTRLALAYLKRHRLLGRPARFDVVLVCRGDDAGSVRIEHLLNAFPAVGRFQPYS